MEEIIYDANMELNFLDNPSMYDINETEGFTDFLENLTRRLPGHVVAHLLLGCIYNKKEYAQGI